MENTTAKYKESTRFLCSLNLTDVDRLAKHGNPAIRKAALNLAAMAERHTHNNYANGLDASDINSALFYATAEEIAFALGKSIQAVR